VPCAWGAAQKLNTETVELGTFGWLGLTTGKQVALAQQIRRQAERNHLRDKLSRRHSRNRARNSTQPPRLANKQRQLCRSIASERWLQAPPGPLGSSHTHAPQPHMQHTARHDARKRRQWSEEDLAAAAVDSPLLLINGRHGVCAGSSVGMAQLVILCVAGGCSRSSLAAAQLLIPCVRQMGGQSSTPAKPADWVMPPIAPFLDKPVEFGPYWLLSSLGKGAFGEALLAVRKRDVGEVKEPTCDVSVSSSGSPSSRSPNLN
jgi:hypothetical protein